MARALDIVIRGRNQTSPAFRAVNNALGNLKTRLLNLRSAMGAMVGMYAGRAIFAGTVGAAASFEKQMANVSTMLSSQAMPIMAQYKKQVRDMAREFGESTETLSKGLYDILSASVAPEQAMKVLETASKAATAGMTDTGIAADALTTILNSYGMKASEVGGIADKLFTTVKRGKITFEQLAGGIGAVASIAHTGGVSLDELLAGVSTLTRSGVSSEESMTALRAIISGFLKPTDDAAAAARGFGIELSSNTLKTEGLVGVMQRLGEAGPEALAKIFPNIRALKGIAPALADLKGFETDLRMMGNAAGATGEAFKKMSETTDKSLQKAKQSLIALGTVIGTAVAPLVIVMADAVSSAVTWWLNLSAETKAFLKTVAVMVPTIIAFHKALLLVNIAFKAQAVICRAVALVQVTLNALTGPVGWLKLAAGVAVATAATLTYKKFLDDAVETKEKDLEGTQQLAKADAKATEITNSLALANKGLADAACDAADGVKEQVDSLKELRTVADRVLNDLYGSQKISSRELLELYDKGLITAREYWQAMDHYNESLQKAKQGAAELFEGLKTPLQKYKEKLTEIHDMLKLGVIDRGDYLKAVNSERDKFLDTVAGDPQTPASRQRAGAAAYESRFMTRTPVVMAMTPAETAMIAEQKKMTAQNAELIEKINLLTNTEIGISRYSAAIAKNTEKQKEKAPDSIYVMGR